ncbi:secreted RxLR effector protein 161-like [Humulus lupulus]|uniref:secreted RxLR effector protein 161-like n=1 Tax=Humulus lupulus TaxID=3486 RepID=UPI002B4136D4|nr:secreted RxLR effector protein 161-like [Humulus lupulus]
MKDLGPTRRILGIEIKRDRRKGLLKLSQSGYIKRIIEIFGKKDAKTVCTPTAANVRLEAVKGELSNEEATYMDNLPYSSAVGSIMYAMIGTRPDIAYGVSLISRFMSKPARSHWQVVKWLLRYLKGSSELGLEYKRGEKQVIGYCDSDYAADLDKRRSLTDFVFTFGGNVISWKSNLQHIVALSTTEVEYVALTEAIKEAIWQQGITKELELNSADTKVYCD